MPARVSPRNMRLRRSMMGGFSFENFMGGLNLRDSPNEIAPNETPDATNWTLDERGAAKLRGGCANVVALPGDTGTEATLFYSTALSIWLCLRKNGANTLRLYSRPANFSGSWTDISGIIGGGGSPDLRFCGFAEFPGNPPKVVLSFSDNASATGGIYTYDGTTFANVSALITGPALALWQNRVWLGGYPSNDANGNVTRLFASAIGDPATWTVAGGGLSVDIRDRDAEPLTGLGLAGGALLVFKKHSAYRVSDASTGAYTLLDAQAGAISPLAVVNFRGRCYTWGVDSIYEWDGVGPGRPVGDKARPLFTSAGLTGTPHVPAGPGGGPAVCGGIYQDQVLFAYPSASNSDNDRILAFDAMHGWLMRHQLPGSTKTTISSFTGKGSDLYGACMNGDIIFKCFTATPGADDGVVFGTANYRTPWIQPSNGKLCRIQRAQLEGLLLTAGTNTLKLRVYKDWDLSSYDEYDVSADLRGSSANDQQNASILRSLGLARAFQFEFVAGTAAGDAAVRGLELETRIGLEG